MNWPVYGALNLLDLAGAAYPVLEASGALLASRIRPDRPEILPIEGRIIG
jgi:hypothetical protein